MTSPHEEIIELRSEAEWREAFPLLHSLRSDLDESIFLQRREQILSHNFTLLGLRVENELVAVAGVDLYPHLSRGVDCWVHDLVTKEGKRSRGYGQTIMRYIESWAKERGCSRVCVHTRIHRKEAQRFYETKLGYPSSAIVYYREV